MIAASEDPSSAAAQVFRRSRAGDFDVAVSTRVAFQLTKPLADSELATYIAEVQVLGSPARWGDATSGVSPSVWGGGDTWASNMDRPNVSFGSRVDDDHVEAHRMSARDHFITLDRAQRRRALRLGLSALTPEELLARYPAGD